MKRISLTQGKYAFIDDSDYDTVYHYKWHASFVKGVWYAERTHRYGNKRYTIRMHRQILGLKHKDGKAVDHRDGNGLNNCRDNLRECSQTQNCYNKKHGGGTSSLYKGVCWCNTRCRWRGYITYRGSHHFLGYFEKEIDAAKTYNEAALYYFGDFANLNSIGDSNDKSTKDRLLLEV